MMTDPMTLTHYIKQKAAVIRFEQLSHDHTIVCANIQQTQLYTDWLIQSSKRGSSKLTPNVLSLNQWLENHYINQQSTANKILPHNQQIIIWHKIITQHITDHATSLSWQRAEQYHHHHQHECQFNHNNHAAQDQAYHYCLQAYQDYLSEHQWIDHATLEKTLPEWLEDFSDTVTFLGFNLLTVSLKNIIDHIPNQSLFLLDKVENSSNETIIKFDNENQQIHFLAQAFKDKLNAKTQTRTGIILPRHSDQQTVIDTTIDYVKHTLNIPLIEEQIATLIPDPIAKHPFIQSLNAALQFFTQPNTQKLIQLLNQPLFQPHNQQGAYQAYLSSIQHIPYQTLHKMSEHIQSKETSDQHEIWQRISAFIQCSPADSSDFATWKNWVADMLDICLTYYKPLDTQEQTLLQLWLDCIYRCHRMSDSDETLDYETWVNYTLLIQKNTYLNTTPASQARFVMMSWSHAIDMPFDELIFVSNHAGNWPANIITDQKHVNQSSFWGQIHSQLQQSCQKITYLFPKHDAQMQERLPSPLLPNHIPVIADHTTPPQSEKLDVIPSIDQPWIMYGSIPKAQALTISTGVIQSYSRCHAQGYFRHRLHIREPEEKFYGIDAIDIGNLVHHALQHLDKVEQELTPDANDIASTINDCIRHNRACRYLTSMQKSALQTHLQNVIQKWLGYRVDLHQDETILNSQHEVVLKKSLFGVTFNIRVDRIDQLHDGSYRIIDYKTGMANRADWLSTRPQNPQLIVYALSVPNTSSIAYACLHPDHYGYSGYCAENKTIDGIKPINQIALTPPDAEEKIMNSWPRQIQMWQACIAEVIKEYRQGSLRLNPAQGKTTCQQCQLQSICRLNERNIHREAHEYHPT